MTERNVVIRGAQTAVSLEKDGAVFRSGEHQLELVSVRVDELELRVDGRIVFVPFLVRGTLVSFSLDGELYEAEVTEKGARPRAGQREGSLTAPMPGVVTKILVSTGDVVTKGTALLVLEAMKMEHQIVASREGTVSSINCAEGQLVQPGVELISLAQD